MGCYGCGVLVAVAVAVAVAGLVAVPCSFPRAVERQPDGSYLTMLCHMSASLAVVRFAAMMVVFLLVPTS